MLRLKSKAPVEVPDKADDPTGRGSSWTNGRELGTKVTTFLLWAAVMCGPFALASSFLAPSQQVVARASDDQSLTEDQQAAGSYASGYVASWLRATKKDSAALSSYVAVSDQDLPDLGWEYRDLGISSVTPEPDSSLVAVVVTADVKEVDMSEDGAGTDIWQRRYFRVAVQVVDGAMGVVGFPTPVAAPQQPKNTANLIYADVINSSDPAYDTVSAFLNAYLVGSGEIARYLAPGTDIAPITPAPYVTLTVGDLRADEKPASTPADGDELQVLATITTQSATGQSLRATYAFTLTARASRWEISSLNDTPTQAPPKAPRTDSGIPTSTTSPTSGTTKGK